MDEIEENIEFFRDAVDETPEDDPEYAEYLGLLGFCYTERYRVTGMLSDLEEGIQLTKQALDFTSQDESSHREHLNRLGMYLGDRYSKTREISDLEEAIQFAREAVTATSHHPDRARHLHNLAISLSDRSSRTGMLSDLDEAVQCLEDAISVTPQDLLELIGHFDELGNCFGNRYSATGTMSDLEQAIIYARKAVHEAPEDHMDRGASLHNLGSHLRKRYLRMGTMNDLDEAIQFARDAITATPQDDPGRLESLSGLGTQLGDRYFRTGVIADVEEAIQLARDVLAATLKDHPARAARLSNLGTQLGHRYLRLGTMADLEEAIQFAREALNATPMDDLKRAGRLSNLGIRLNDRYLRTGAIGDLEEAVQFASEAVETIPQDHVDRAECLSTLGIQLGTRFSRTGIMSDLEGSIKFARESLNATTPEDPNRLGRLNNLGIRLGDRYSRTGIIDDLEGAIQFAREALTSAPKDHPDYTQLLVSLANHLNERYSRVGMMADLEEAANLSGQAVTSTPKGSLGRLGYLNNLASQLGEKYVRTGKMEDLHEAIRHAREAANTVPQGDPEYAAYFNNLGVRLGDLYARTKRRADLDEAIRCTRKAIQLFPREHPDRAGCLHNLGNYLSDQYSRTGVMANLEEAIQFATEAADTTPNGNPDRSMYLNDLAVYLHDRYLKTGKVADIEEALSRLQSALHQGSSLVLDRIETGRNIIRYSALSSDWTQAYEASQFVIDLLPQLSSRSLENSDRQHMLSQVAGLASNAAAAAINAEKGPLGALSLLEQGRGLIATSLEEMRTDILDLHEAHPKLADRFISLRNELEAPIPRGSFGPNHESSRRAQADQRYQVAKELETLVAEIHKKDGFNDFLLAPSEREMQASAQYGPIAVINVSEFRCDAILVEQQRIRLVPLPDLNIDDIRTRSGDGNLGRPEVLEWLWDVIANPILQSLGFTGPPSNNDWPRLWWIPTGLLSKFPLHAAGRHCKGSFDAVCDRVMSSYSSSIKAIIYGRQRPPPSADLAVLVAMEHTPGNSSLPFATKEIRVLDSIFESMELHPFEPERRKQDVMSQLLQCKVFHFAGHGHTDDEDPSKSYLLLADGRENPLMVADLLTMNLRKQSPFLAYLSACGTGQINNTKLFDESVHLISAFQLAGFRHVIGTLWEVNDELCVDMARIAYEGIRDGGMTDESVCRGLHNATRQLRDRWLNRQPNKRSGSEAIVKEGVRLDARLGDERLPRDALLDEDEDDYDKGLDSLYWVPYVHFGV